jgi:predicted adenylyl cyclase CyaB
MINVEIKARYSRTEETELIMQQCDARFIEKQVQTDTYFKVREGRLKIREIDGAGAQMIRYVRDDQKAPATSHYEIVEIDEPEETKRVLDDKYGLDVVVKKEREIWIWENVRIHLDKVENLGEFLEFEAVIHDKGRIEAGQEKIVLLLRLFGIQSEDLLEVSYERMIKEKGQ